MSEPGQWLSVAESAGVSGVSERTVWRWVRDGVVESRHEKRGQQSTRLINRESLPEGVSESVPGCQEVAGVDSASQASTPPSHDVSPDAAGGDIPHNHRDTEGDKSCHNHRAELAEQKASLLESEVQHLREMVSHQAEQLHRHSVAEEQLRQLLLTSQTLAAQLAHQLEVKALPPAPESVETPRRARWWHLLWR